MVFGNFCQAQSSRVKSDRLNYSANTNLVDKKNYQVETGYFLTKNVYPRFNTYYAQLPSVLQRYGLSNRIELRLNIISAAVFARNNDSYSTNYYLSGIEGPEIGAKFKLIKQKKLVPNISLLSEVKLQPLGGQRFRRDNLRPTILILMSHELPHQLVLGYNIGSTWDTKFYYNYDVYIQKQWGKKLIANINFADQWFAPDETGPNKQKRLCSSIGYYFTDKILADIGLGWGIENAPNNFYKVGVSFGF